MSFIKMKNKGYEFLTHEKKIMIPSKEFPLANKNKKDIKIFIKDITEPVSDETIINIFNSIEIEIGKCFTNAQKLLLALENENIQGWEYYSGWNFVYNSLPVFHTWIAKDNQVLDFTNKISNKDLEEKIMSCSSALESRELFKNFLIEENKKKHSDSKICGQIHDNFLFIGTKDTYANATRIFSSLPKNHISYSQPGMNISGKSRLQNELEKCK